MITRARLAIAGVILLCLLATSLDLIIGGVPRAVPDLIVDAILLAVLVNAFRGRARRERELGRILRATNGDQPRGVQ